MCSSDLQNVDYEYPVPALPGSYVQPGTVTPNFLGSTVRAVTTQAVTTNLKVQLIGSGVAFEQFPAPGAVMPEGAVITVKFRIGSPTAPPATPAANAAPQVMAQGKPATSSANGSAKPVAAAR